MKLHIESFWRASVTVDTDDLAEPLGDDFDPSDLHSWPSDLLEQVTAQGAELVDWTVVRQP